MKEKTKLSITFEHLEFRKITLQEKRKQESDLDIRNQDDPKWLAMPLFIVHLGWKMIISSSIVNEFQYEWIRWTPIVDA